MFVFITESLITGTRVTVPQQPRLKVWQQPRLKVTQLPRLKVSQKARPKVWQQRRLKVSQQARLQWSFVVVTIYPRLRFWIVAISSPGLLSRGYVLAWASESWLCPRLGFWVVVTSSPALLSRGYVLAWASEPWLCPRLLLRCSDERSLWTFFSKCLILDTWSCELLSHSDECRMEIFTSESRTLAPSWHE